MSVAPFKAPGVKRFGRRTLVLLHVGVIWAIMGWLIYSTPTDRFSGPGPGSTLQFMDSRHWGFLWIIGGGLAVVNAILRRKWDGRDVLGFLGLVTPPFMWVVAYAWSGLVYLFTDGVDGNPRAVLAILIWYAITTFILIVAGWPDSTDPDIEVKLERRR